MEVPGIRLKYWPVEYNAQAGVWAALRLREEIGAADIASIDIATYWSAWHEIGSEPEKWNPTTRETAADHSLLFIFARALTDGTITLGSFGGRGYQDPLAAAVDGENHRARRCLDRGAVSRANRHAGRGCRHGRPAMFDRDRRSSWRQHQSDGRR